MLSDALLNPSGVAVIGASARVGTMGWRLINAMSAHGFAGQLAAVNPNYSDIDGVPCFPSVDAVPFPVDLVLLGVPAAGTEQAIAEAAARGVRGAVVFSSGFAEIGADGKAAQDRLAHAARGGGVRVLGPNCQGLVDFRSGMTASFAPAVLAADRTALAPIAYVGQSGAIGGVFFDLARQRGRTPTAWVSTGNEMDVSSVEVAGQLADSGDFELVCLYLERVPTGTQWFELLDAAAVTSTRLAVLRSGRSDLGRTAAASHTGAMVGDDAAFELSCRLAGVTVVDDVNDLVEVAVATRRSRPRPERGVAVITTSGGAGCLAVDQLDRAGLAIAVLSPATQHRLRELLPPFASSTNPVDVTAELMMRRPADLRSVVSILLDDPEVDQVLLVVTNLVGEMAVTVADAFAGSDSLPLSVAYLTATDQIGDAALRWQRGGVAVHPSIAAAIRAMACSRVRQLPAPRPLVASEASAPVAVSSTTEWGATPLLDWAGVRRPAGVLVQSPDEAGRAAAAMGGPVVLKVQSAQVLHKSELGAVRVGIEPEQSAAVAADMLIAVADLAPRARIDGILVQEMAPRGVELLVGVRAGAAGYPATVTVGIGGTAVELYQDIASAFAPITVAQAEDLIRSLRGAPLLTGARGAPECDVAAAADAIARLSGLMQPGILEIEVNPLIVHQRGDGATAVDLLVRRSCSVPAPGAVTATAVPAEVDGRAV